MNATIRMTPEQRDAIAYYDRTVAEYRRQLALDPPDYYAATCRRWIAFYEDLKARCLSGEFA